MKMSFFRFLSGNRDRFLARESNATKRPLAEMRGLPE
jgi:hypothetical protein